MARNEEKHYGRLNRLILLKEKEEYEKKNPKRPRLELLDTPEEIKKWLPSIKQDIDFYLKKSQVTCYSDEHIEECKLKVTKLEKEFKAFVRKISQLTPGGLEATPWTNRPYKRKAKDSAVTGVPKAFVRISTPLLDEEKRSESFPVHASVVNLPLMDKPLNFNFKREEDLNCNLMYTEPSESNSKSPLFSNLIGSENEASSNSICVNDLDSNYKLPSCASHIANKTESRGVNQLEMDKKNCDNQICIVNYDSSDVEDPS